MSVPWLVVVVVGVLSVGLLTVMVAGLVHQLKRLNGSVRAFGEDVTPLAAELQAEALRAQERVEKLSERRPGSGGGARIRS